MDIAVPLGIIINELVSNSLKHAFPGKEEGLIQIKLCRENPQSMQIVDRVMDRTPNQEAKKKVITILISS